MQEKAVKATISPANPEAAGGPGEPSGRLYFVDAEGGLGEMERSANLDGLEFTEHKEQDNGAVYKGYLKNGLRHGPGQQIWPDGATYRGEWVDDKANGQGKFWHADGDTYDGQWRDDKANGRGTYVH